MKLLLLAPIIMLLCSCSGGSDNKDSDSTDEGLIFCKAESVLGNLSGASYEIPIQSVADVLEIPKITSIANGSVSYTLTATCDETGAATTAEVFNGATCDAGNDFNPLDVICEPKVFYAAVDLGPEGKLKVFNLESAFVNSGTNTFKVIINDVETYASDTQAEVTDGKIQINPDLGSKLEILTAAYVGALQTDDEVCFEFNSESRQHCYFFDKPLKVSRDKILSVFNTATQSLDLLNSAEYSILAGNGSSQNKNVLSVDERGSAAATDYLELSYRAVHFDVDFTLDSGKLYNINLEVNSEVMGTDTLVFVYDKEDFDSANYQQNYIEKFYISASDNSLRRKILSHDFTVSPLQKAEKVTVLIYAKSKILVRDFNIEEVDLLSTVKDHSLFLTSEANRDGFSTNSVPNMFVPHGMPGGYGYGNFAIDSLLEKYEIYVNYEDRFKTTQAHIYDKASLTGDSLMGWNFRGANDSAPGGNSQDFLHGTLYQGLGWSSIKSNPEDYAVIFHTEGGHFALDGSNLLMNYNSFAHETSVGGVAESGTRFNNRVSRKLSDRPLRAQNTNDPGAPVVTTADHTDYYEDVYKTAYAQDDGFGGVELTLFADGMGYTLLEDFLFYLYDDQGSLYDSGGPEGALVGTLHPQVSYLDYRVSNSLTDEDTDSDGVSDRIEYITHTDPNDNLSLVDLSIYDIFPDDGNAYKYVSLPISKEAKNFNIIVYEVLSNGVEKPLWSFDRGRGMESPLINYVYEYEDYFVLELLSKEISGTAVDLRLEFQ